MRISCMIMGICLLAACNNGPKVITATQSETSPTRSSGVFSSSESAPSPSGAMQKVLVKDILPASRYVYLFVNNGEEDYWIATRKQAISKGAIYKYRDGLLKTNFESKEHGRVFDKIFLVSNLLPEAGQVHAQKPEGFKPMIDASLTQKVAAHTPHAGAVAIATLIQNPDEYLDKEIVVSGTCVKVNANIMGRNWIHIQDGTADDYDLVVTSKDFIHEGAPVSIRAMVHQNVDFGAGYRYDLILENGSVIR